MASRSNMPVKLVLKGTSSISLNQRFDNIYKTKSKPQEVRIADHVASAKNRRLAAQMANRPNVLRALGTQRSRGTFRGASRGGASRGGASRGGANQLSVKDRLGTSRGRANQVVRGRGRNTASPTRGSPARGAAGGRGMRGRGILRGAVRGSLRGGARGGLRGSARGGLRGSARGGLRGGVRGGLRGGVRSGLRSGARGGSARGGGRGRGRGGATRRPKDNVNKSTLDSEIDEYMSKAGMDDELLNN